MTTIQHNLFHVLKAGSKIPGDWYPGTIPPNIEIGNEVMMDSSFCFKHFFSTLPVAMRIGDFVTFWRTAISLEENGYVEIGSYSYITNASIVCSERISIGSRVFIAGGVTIVDSDFHPVTPAARLCDTIALSPMGNRSHRPRVNSSPVTIEDDVWIGYNATILKGVTVGRGATVEPGAVVLTNVDPGTTVAGNPAKPVTV